MAEMPRDDWRRHERRSDPFPVVKARTLYENRALNNLNLLSMVKTPQQLVSQMVNAYCAVVPSSSFVVPTVPHAYEVAVASQATRSTHEVAPKRWKDFPESTQPEQIKFHVEHGALKCAVCWKIPSFQGNF